MPPPDALTPEERQQLAKMAKKLQDSRPVCHRHFYSQVIQSVEPVEPQSQIALPDGQPAQPGMMEVKQTLQAGFPPCYAEKCMMWDKRKNRCLDRTIAIQKAYGNADPDD